MSSGVSGVFPWTAQLLFFVHLLVAMQCPEADILDLLATGLMIFMALLKSVANRFINTAAASICFITNASKAVDLEFQGKVAPFIETTYYSSVQILCSFRGKDTTLYIVTLISCPFQGQVWFWLLWLSSGA